MNLALVQIEALVKQTQYQYLIAFASNIGISLRSSIHRMGAVQAYQANNKRELENKFKEQLTISNTEQSIVGSNQKVEDKTTSDKKRFFGSIIKMKKIEEIFSSSCIFL